VASPGFQPMFCNNQEGIDNKNRDGSDDSSFLIANCPVVVDETALEQGGVFQRLFFLCVLYLK
jgi:hypothetical protein